MRSEYEADLYLNPEDMSPLYFYWSNEDKGEGRMVDHYYDRAHRRIETTYQNEGEEKVIKNYPLDGRTIDLFSLLYLLRSLDPPAMEKESVSLSLLLAGKTYPANLSCLGEDRSFMEGEQACHMLLTLPERGIMENGGGNTIHVWLSTRETRMILGIEIPLNNGMMTATLKP